jgi:CHASE3 domain
MTLREALDRALSTRLAYPIIAAALLGVFVINEWTHRRTQTLMIGGSELTQQRLQAMEALQRLTDAETAQRGFLITGREEYLQPYEAARAELPAKLNPTLEFLSNAGEDAGVDAASARQLIDAKLAELAAAIELQRAGKRSPSSNPTSARRAWTRFAPSSAVPSKRPRCSVKRCSAPSSAGWSCGAGPFTRWRCWPRWR